MGFSEFRLHITVKTSTKSVLDSINDAESNISYMPVCNPRLFKKMGKIEGFNRIFELFFEAVVKDERLANMYGIEPDDSAADVD